MKILKNKTINTKVKFNYIDKYDYIVIGLQEGKSLSLIAEEKGVGRQAIQKQFERVCEEVEEIESSITELINNFDTFLNLEEVIEKKWVNFIARMFIFKDKNTFISTINRACIVSRKLSHSLKIIKRGDKEIEGCEIKFLESVKDDIPTLLKDVATELGVNATKLQECLDVLFPDRVVVVSGFILSVRKAIILPMALYMNSEEIKYDGTLKELYELFLIRHRELFLFFNINSFEDFISKLKRNIDKFKFVSRRADTKEYENVRYMQKHKIEEFIHHLKK